jgi:hypothetical protein
MPGVRAFRDAAVTALVMAPFLVGMVILWRGYGVHHDVFIFGTSSWGVGCLIKLAVYHLGIRRLSHDPRHLRRVSLLNGLSSGVTELGAALVFFAFLPRLTLADVIGFGLAIGALEAFLSTSKGTSELLAGTELEDAARKMEAAYARQSRGRRLALDILAPLAERLIAGGLHVGTRGLVYVSYLRGEPLLTGGTVTLAVGIFVVADGLVGYRWLREGRLEVPVMLVRAYAVLAALAALGLAVFLWCWPGDTVS